MPARTVYLPRQGAVIRRSQMVNGNGLWRRAPGRIAALGCEVCLKRIFEFCAVVSILSCPCVFAQKQSCEMDPARSQVQFTLPASLHEVHGSFHLQRGSVLFSRAGGEISGVIAVDAHSGNSGESSRDKKMTNDELKADQFTAVVFAPKSYTGALAAEGDSDVVVQGVFTLLGTEHDLRVPMHVHLDHGMCAAKGTFSVPFTKWGMKDPSTFLLKVGKEVTVTLDLVGAGGHE